MCAKYYAAELRHYALGGYLEPDHKRIAKRVIELSGGRKKLIEETQRNLSRLTDKWNQDVGAMGRILRAHLFVEHFITACLITFNPGLGDVAKARLSFAQKLALIEDYSQELRELSQGIARLNRIRNRMAHNLEAQVTDQDRTSLLSVKTFKALREDLSKPGSPSENGIDVLEDFAKHVGIRLSSLADPASLARRFEIAFHQHGEKT